MSTGADGGVRAFYKWLRQYGGGRVPCSLPQNSPGVATTGRFNMPEHVLDKWYVHTRTCAVCRKMLDRMVALYKWARRLAVVALVAACTAKWLGKGVTGGGPMVVGVAIAVACVILAGWAEEQAHRFVSYKPKRG